MDIEFICRDKNIVKYWHPVPAADIIPDKIKKMPDKTLWADNTVENIKGCMPAMDMATAGYVLPVSIEMIAESTFENFKKNLKLESARINDLEDPDIRSKKVMAVYKHESCPMVINGKKQDYYFKYSTDWIVKTPPGYSCLVVQPFMLFEDRFSVIPAIVDTDTYDSPIPVVGYTNLEKLILRPGEYVVQVIPFKREDWNMKITHNPTPQNRSKFYVKDVYKRLYHKVKKFI